MMESAKQETGSVAARTGAEPSRRGPDDLFTLGRSASATARGASSGRGVFSRSRQLLASGAWRGPRDAAEAFIEEEDLAAVGGLAGAQSAGVRTVVARSAEVARAAAAAGARVLYRFVYRAGESEESRVERLAALAALAAEGVAIDGVVPTPEGEPLGLDSLRVVALCRVHAGLPHVVIDFARLGHRLAQMALGFGGDELWGPIVSERALRLGDNANNPAMTRKEAATLIRGAGLAPFERGGGGTLEEYVP